MAGDILGMYGRDTQQTQTPSRTMNGTPAPKPINYSAPTGPKGINDPKTPGIHGTNHGVCGTQGKR